MTPAGLNLRDWAVVVLGYTARLQLFKASHFGYAPAEWALVCDAEFQHGRDVRELAAETNKGETA